MLKQNKRLCILLVLLMILTLTACGRKQTVDETTEEVDITAGFENKKDYITTTRPDTLIYRLPKEDAEVYATLKPGVDLMRTGVLGAWTRIRLNDTTLYVMTENVKATQIDWVKDQTARKNQHVVYIDPSKQIYADKKTEAVFPGGDPEKEGKPRMARAAVGKKTGQFEYDVTLAMAEKLKHELELRGYTVILSRSAGTASISNAERAQAGNQSNAEILIRLTAQASSDKATHGIYGLIASAKNQGTSKYYQDSFYLSNMLLTEACASTEALRLGIYQTDKMVFLNYAKKPAAVIQLGFLSNTDEDTKLADDAYREKMASGLADGVDAYFEYVDSK